MPTPEQLFAERLARDPGRPFVTYYDEASGERSELSTKSLANWVAKTYHLVAGELGLGVGDRARIDVPPHWISVPVLLGCLAAGLELVGPDDPERAEVAFIALGRPAGADEVFVIDADRAAIGISDPPGAVNDYVRSVRPQPDAWAGVHLAATGDDPFAPGTTRAQAVAAGRQRATDRGWPESVRLLSTRDWAGPDDWIDTLVAPLAVSGSVVYLRHLTDPEVLDRRAAQERCTARLG